MSFWVNLTFYVHKEIMSHILHSCGIFAQE